MTRIEKHNFFLNFGIILSMAVLALSIGIRLGASYMQSALREELKASDLFSIRQLHTLGVEYADPSLREERIRSHNFCDPVSWDNGQNEFRWAPHKGKDWIVWELSLFVDADAVYDDLKVFNAVLDGEVVVNREYHSLQDFASMCSSAQNIRVNGTDYLLLKWTYRFPFLLKASRGDYIRVYTTQNKAVKGKVCFATATLTELAPAKVK